MFNDCSLSVRNKNKRPMGHNAHLSELLLKLIFSTILQSFSSTHLKAFDGVNFVVFFFIYLNYFFLQFRLPCQPIKFNHLERIQMFGRGLLKKHFCKTVLSEYLQ